MITINTLNELEDFLVKNDSVAVYFSTPDCNVCKVLKPKVYKLIQEKFSKMKFVYVDLSSDKTISGQLSIYAVPTIIFYFEGKEFLRKSRNINLDVLEGELQRPYSLFNEG